MSDSGLTQWEKGRRRIPLDQLERIAHELGRPLSYFTEPVLPIGRSGTDLLGLDETEALARTLEQIAQRLRAGLVHHPKR
jgi:transcriptional regulator with XRE-family HTH domain